MNVKVVVPLTKKQNSNHTQNDVFLWFFESANIYLMDNHRLAFWCWLNGGVHKGDFGKCAFVHIDDHFDCCLFNVNEMMAEIEKNKLFFYQEIDNFRENENGLMDQDGVAFKTFNWANYLVPAIYKGFFDNGKLYFFVPSYSGKLFAPENGDIYKLNDKVSYTHYDKKNLSDLEIVLQKENNIILNIDFDYFEEFLDEPMLIKKYFSLINKYKVKIKLMTVALTPNPNGDWSKSEKILKIFFNVFGLNIPIPLAIN